MERDFVRLHSKFETRFPLCSIAEHWPHRMDWGAAFLYVQQIKQWNVCYIVSNGNHELKPTENKSLYQFPNDPFQLYLSSVYSLVHTNENVCQCRKKKTIHSHSKGKTLVNRLTNDKINICFSLFSSCSFVHTVWSHFNTNSDRYIL